MDPETFKKRTKDFALRIIRLVESLQRSCTGEAISRQLVRSGTSVGANYRAACRARSTKDFIAKLKLVEEECDETMYWLELLVDAKLVKASVLKDLEREAGEILAMIVSSIKTTRSRSNRKS